MNREAAVIIKEMQSKPTKSCVVIDEAHVFDPQIAEGIGVDLDCILVSQPESRGETIKILRTLVRDMDNACIILMMEQNLASVGVGAIRQISERANEKHTSIIDLSWCNATE